MSAPAEATALPPVAASAPRDEAPDAAEAAAHVDAGATTPPAKAGADADPLAWLLGPPGLLRAQVTGTLIVNDRHGHAVGDEVLRGFAGVAREHLRAHDMLARWGGEEFLVLLPQTPRAEARHALDRLQACLAAACASVMPHGLSISFSAGVVEMRPEETLDAAIERADQAMYQAKTLGRARCVEA